MNPRQDSRVAPMRWLREAAPLKQKLDIALGVTASLAGTGIALGCCAVIQAPPVSGAAGAWLPHWPNVMIAGCICVSVVAALAGALFTRMIAVPYVTIVCRMESLAEGDLASPIPYTSHTDCVGRIAKAMFTFRDTAIAQHKSTELNRSQSVALWSANTKLERLARHLSRALEDAKLASQAKSRFLAGMSHELRTPLNGLLGYARLLRLDGALNPAQEERVSAMLVAGAHLLDTINRVLDITEIESERAELKPSITEVVATAKACLDMIRPSAASKQLMLKLTHDRETPAQLITDATRLRQVMLNLLGNAVKFIAIGSVEMRLGPAHLWPDGLRVEVADSGPGIPKAQRAHLFQEFERLDPAVSGSVEGAGLGLALSQRLACMLGGTIGHEDNPAGGSIFWLELPPLPASSGLPETGESAAEDAVSVTPLRILVVDDLAMNREIAHAFLSAAGHQVICADGGAAAVSAVASQDFDVVVMDVRMPEMDGLEATRCIRALPAPHGLVPIVAMTAQAFAEQVHECRSAGMNFHVTKPFAPEELTQAVARAAAARSTDSPVIAPQEAAAPSPGPVSQDIESGTYALDESQFLQTSSALPPDVLRSFLQTLSARSEVLAERISQLDAQAPGSHDIADLAHMLAGSAGMFGFRRLATAAKHYEYAVHSHAADTHVLASSLADAIQDAMGLLGNKLAMGIHLPANDPEEIQQRRAPQEVPAPAR